MQFRFNITGSIFYSLAINCQIYKYTEKKENMLFKSEEMELIADRLRTRKTLNTDYLEVDSNYGHDAFLVELDKFDDYVTKALHE